MWEIPGQELKPCPLHWKHGVLNCWSSREFPCLHVFVKPSHPGRRKDRVRITV